MFGSWRFIVVQTVVVAAWVALNLVAVAAVRFGGPIEAVVADGISPFAAVPCRVWSEQQAGVVAR